MGQVQQGKMVAWCCNRWENVEERDETGLSVDILAL